uniref:EOG090X081J n=1 Tax=Eubosmina coregoni TaxID=186181 RepID=A0A4Y7LQM7_9CRUS|nr:EOG090X081J [Eubosmina coregoni]SVE69865.1 EOG090X081J [Eubosmina coregoni]
MMMNRQMCSVIHLFSTGLVFVFVAIPAHAKLGKVIFGVNAGGESHTDIYGVKYQKDPLEVGTASDYGRQYLNIGRVAESDAILYQTERYHHSNFGYDIPIVEDGDYVLVLKFCEVYFNAPSQKVFDVTLNGVHTVVSYLDIFEKVGKAVAHDEYISFRVTKGKILVNDEESELVGKKVKVEFIKGNQDNPKVNAIYVMKGLLEDVPKLSPMTGEAEDDEDKPLTDHLRAEEAAPVPKKKREATAKIANPYTDEPSALMLPIFVAIAACVPFLFCLCKL